MKTVNPADQVSGDKTYPDVKVVYVFDGDTIKLADGEKVRFIGIDTPESSRNKKLLRDAGRSGRDVQQILEMGHQAAVYTRSLLDGRRVRLDFDIQRRDKYGRLLAYVYRVDDGLFINEEIIKNGYAYPMTIPPNIRHAEEFKRSFRQARKSRLGLWAQFSSDADVKD
ncbi:MAG: thermonuclease family protein [Candidatus Omnitrophica bacterium]|nr:thermonuclease family protein [Candidatus Omnitrophota bacterium]